MNEKFFDIKKEKQDRIINASLKVFADKGYKHASTDTIVQEAGISKGLLFHYFTSKLGLYTFLFNYSVRYMSLELSTGVNKEKNDFFALMKQMEMAKLQVLKNYPYMQQFIDSTRYEDVKEALLSIEEKKNKLVIVKEEIMNCADLSKLKPEVEVTKLKRVIDFMIQGMMKESFSEGCFHPDMMYGEINSYLDMLQMLTYQ